MYNYYTNPTLLELREQLFSQLKALSYSQSTIAGYRAAISSLQTFTEEHNQKYYSKEIGMEFLAEYQLKEYFFRSNRSFRTTVNRLDDIIEGWSYRQVHSSNRKHIPSLFHSILEDYQVYLRHYGNKEATIKVRSTYCAELLCNLELYGLKSLVELHTKHIYHALIDTSSREGFCEKIPKFLKYLYQVNITTSDYSQLVPRFYAPQILPEVYTEAEIICILEKVDTSTAIGIRDYAILVMVALLGIRASDICHLSSDNICYKNDAA